MRRSVNTAYICWVQLVIRMLCSKRNLQTDNRVFLRITGVERAGRYSQPLQQILICANLIVIKSTMSHGFHAFHKSVINVNARTKVHVRRRRKICKRGSLRDLGREYYGVVQGQFERLLDVPR